MVDDDPTMPVLDGVRVLDAISGRTQTIGRFLAELGADVVRIESPEAAGERMHRSAGSPDIGFAVRNSGKRGIVLDRASVAGRERFDALLAGADILLDDSPAPHGSAPNPSGQRGDDLDETRLAAINPRLVTLRVTDFGLVGPRRQWKATPDVLFALSGVLSRSGLPDAAEPLLPPEHLAYESASMQAVWTVLLAHSHARRTGKGDHIDFSVLDALMHLLDPGYGIGGSARAGAPMKDLPRGRPDARHLYPTFRALDGFVRICVLSRRQWHAMLEWLGNPPELVGDRYDDITTRQLADAVIKPYYERLFAGITRAEAVAAGRRFGVPAAGLLTATEVLDEPAFAAAGSFTELDLGHGVRTTVPTGLVEIDGAKAGVRLNAPTPGEHDDEVDAEWLARRPEPGAEIEAEAEAAAGSFRIRPFEGLRVLDLGVIVVGAEVGRLFADYGADVIKLESVEFPDGSRQTYGGQQVTEGFCWGHRNKRSLGLNLKDPEGRALFEHLVAEADIVLSNFKPGTLEKLGIGYPELRAINPRIIVSESSAFGSHGPWSDRMGYGPLVRASSGLSLTWQYPGVDFGFSDIITIYPDHVAARVSASAVAALLLRRERTGRGGHVSSAQIDVIFSSMAEQLATERLHEGTIRAEGNRRGQDAPTGPFQAAGDDEWLVVDVRSTTEFQALATAIGRPDWAADDDLSTREGRLARASELESGLASWTKAHTPTDAERTLQAAGVPAGRMVRVADLEHDEHCAGRGLLGLLAQPQFDEPLTTFLAEARFASGLSPLLAPAPLQGEHTAVIAAERLGLDTVRAEELIARGVLQPYRVPTRSPAGV